MGRAIMTHSSDNVATLVTGITANQLVDIVNGQQESKLESKENIQFGHKLAVMNIGAGENVIKYGEVIGKALKDIEAGQHVHIHNVESQRGRGDRK